MSSTQNKSAFTVPLTLKAHQIAEEFYQQQLDTHKAKQVYLNTLAVYAADFYLKCMGIKTNLEGSASWNPVMQTLSNSADLEIPDYGKLECRFVLPGTEVCHIPAEVQQDRLGYLVVQLDAELTEAILLGFTPVVAGEELSLTHLQPVTELLNIFSSPLLVPDHGISLTEVSKLSQWLQDTFEESWQSLENLFSSYQFAFRGRSLLPNSQLERDTAQVSRGKAFDLKLPSADRRIALLVGIRPTSQFEVDVWIKVQPIDERHNLPPDLCLSILDSEGYQVMQAQARDPDVLGLKFSGDPGERFTVKVTVGDFTITEPFMI